MIASRSLLRVILIFAGGVLSPGVLAAPGAPPKDTPPAPGLDRHLEQIHLPRELSASPADRPVVVAVVDDAVRVTHRDILPFLWSHAGETPGNRVDDDGNGAVDDVHGWDVADGDGDVSPPPRRQSEFFHGTHLAGLVTRMARAVYGESAPSHLRILPVKALSDTASRTYLQDGFAGVEYAIDAGADIVLCGWSLSQISPREAAILEKARRRGVLVVGSAGNYPEGREQFPAAHEAVLAVAALDEEDRKSADSNFGRFVDLAAPGIAVLSSGVGSDEAEEERDGTSQAAALVAGAAALVRSQHPDFTARELTVCLKQGARPLETADPRYPAQLGAGAIDVARAIECSLLSGDGSAEEERRNPQGFVRLRGSAETPGGWTIRPDGRFEGLRFQRYGGSGSGDGVIGFYGEQAPRATQVFRGRLSELPESVYVPGTTAHVVHEPAASDEGLEWLLEYRAEPIDFPRLHCRDTVTRDAEGTLQDGSGPRDYSWNTDCKWLITAPEGQVVDVRFTEFDTEPNADFVYLFDGAGTHEEVMARFSGSELPPAVTSWRHQVLVWFVTDGDHEGRGWTMEYRFRDP